MLYTTVLAIGNESKKMNREVAKARRALAKTAGRFFYAEFTKRTNGELRKLVGRLGVKKHVNGKGLSYNPKDYDLQVVWDSQKKWYRMIPLREYELIYLRCGNLVFTQTIKRKDAKA